jgi:hypothetical protein
LLRLQEANNVTQDTNEIIVDRFTSFAIPLSHSPPKLQQDRRRRCPLFFGELPGKMIRAAR